MRQEDTGTDGTLALRGADHALAVPTTPAPHALGGRWADAPARLRRRTRTLLPVELGARPGQLALAAITLSTLADVVFATAGSSILVPRSAAAYPGWEAGPLRLIFGHPTLSQQATRIGFSLLVIAMFGAYVVVLRSARALSLRLVWLFALVVPLILLLGPPQQLNDVWNYLGYARLGALHHLSPYTFTMKAESNDPIFTFSTWQNYSSPYGPLFTALSYPLAVLSIPLAYWALKLAIVAAALGFVWTVGWCARLLGRDPRFAILFVAANPIYVFYAIGGFHNDVLMLLPATAAIGFLLDRRDRLAGATLMLAVAVKPTAIILLPFLLIAARPPQRRPQVLVGCLMSGIPLLALSLALFGFSLPNLATQSRLITGYSIPNLVGLAIGAGGSTTLVVRALSVVVVLVVLWALRKRDWIAGAGWSTLALVASVSWLMPWYVIWVLPLAGLAQSRALRRAALALTVFLVLTFVPEWGTLMSTNGVRPMASPVDQASLQLQAKLQK